MDTLKSKYQIEKNENRLSFRPFHYYKSRWKWYGASILLAVLLVHIVKPMGENTYIIVISVLILTVFYFIKDYLKSKVKYIFDAQTNAVYKSSYLSSNKKLMALQDVVFFRSSEMGSWHYAMGAKKKQFIKSYAVSENFGNDEKSMHNIDAFEKVILSEIDRLII